MFWRRVLPRDRLENGPIVVSVDLAASATTGAGVLHVEWQWQSGFGSFPSLSLPPPPTPNAVSIRCSSQTCKSLSWVAIAVMQSLESHYRAPASLLLTLPCWNHCYCEQKDPCLALKNVFNGIRAHPWAWNPCSKSGMLFQD